MRKYALRPLAPKTGKWKEQHFYFHYWTEKSERGRPHELKLVVGPEKLRRLRQIYPGRELDEFSGEEILFAREGASSVWTFTLNT